MDVLKSLRKGWSRIQADRYEGKLRRQQIKRVQRDAEFEGRLAGAKREAYRKGYVKEYQRARHGRGARAKGGLKAVGHFLMRLEPGPAFGSDPFLPTRRRSKRRRRR